MCVCICMCEYVRVYVCVCQYVSTHAYMCVHVFVCLPIVWSRRVQTAPDEQQSPTVVKSCDWLSRQLIDRTVSLSTACFALANYCHFSSVLMSFVCWRNSQRACLFAISHPRTTVPEREGERDRWEEMKFWWQMDLINNPGVSSYVWGKWSWTSGCQMEVCHPPLQAFHGIMKCKVRNSILLQFSAPYQNKLLPFDCAHSMCESTIAVLTRQTGGVCMPGYWHHDLLGLELAPSRVPLLGLGSSGSYQTS